jgi:hypothetical protein
MTCRLALTAVIALMVGLMGACGGVDRGEGAQGGAHPLVTYSREGGIRFQVSRLTVSTEGRATVRSEGCKASFRLRGARWGRLQRLVERIDWEALAGDYPPPPGAADTITETIVVGRHTVRIGDFSSLPLKAQRELKPLLRILGDLAVCR